MKRITYAIHEHDNLQKEWNTRIPVIDMRLNTSEARLLDTQLDLVSMSGRIPENVETLLTTL